MSILIDDDDLLALLLEDSDVSFDHKLHQDQITPRHHHDALPLSFAQQRLWFLQHLDPETSAYNLLRAFRVQGNLDADALEQAIQQIIARHEVLRTAFIEIDGTAEQQVLASVPFHIARQDWSSDHKSSQDEQIERALGMAAQHVFDLSHPPLIAATLIHISDHAQILILLLHHIVSDAWSNPIFVRELGLGYRAALGQSTASLDKLPVQYADFALWQRERLAGETLQRELNYWQGYLGDHVPALELPTDRPRPIQQSLKGARLRSELSADGLHALRQFCRLQGLTVFVPLLAVWQSLLSRYSRQNDFAVGVPHAGRGRLELEELIGFFINTQVYRVRLNEYLSTAQLCRNIAEQAQQALNHQELPLELLLEHMSIGRDLSRSPLFQTMFNLQSQQGAAQFSLAGIPFAAIQIPETGAKFDLTLDVIDQGARVIVDLEYNTDLFNPETAARMLGHYKQLLSAMLQQPNARLGSLPLLSTDESRTQLKAWNATDLPLPVAQDMIALFESQVARIPDQVAVTFGPDSISYQALNERANQLAHWLRQQGVTTDRLVAVSLEREVMLLVALLAIQKAGGGYLPLDPAQPKDRNAYIIEHAQPVLLLTRDALQQDAYIPCPILTLEAFDQVRHELPAVNLGLAVHDRQLAYALYTSGSTGRPKGVQIERIAFVNFLHAMQAQLSLSTQHRFLAITTLGFDIAGLELFLSLVQGATVVLTSRSEAQDSGALIGLLQQHAITHLQATPATWQMLLDEADSQVWRGLNALCGGEALGAELATRLLARGVNLLNVYGPTETTVWSAAYPVKGVNQSVLPIGQAIANNRLYILDGELNPVPIGAVGDLYIGGIGLARGYLARPDLTAAAFIPNPFADQSNDQNSDQNNGYGSGLGSRLYRTGDLARYRADGTIDFLGRSDFQVKIRGFRIELGEIEAVLERHPQIRQAVVTAFDDRLAAYVTVDQDQSQSLSLSDIQAFAGNLLPAYMVPSSVTVLESFPLNSNGKVDRKQLPEPDAVLEALEIILPRDSVETELHAIWQLVLNRSNFGVTDDFFALGGHSLLATRVMSRIRQELHVDLPLRVLFEASTIAALATHVRQIPQRSVNALIPRHTGLRDQDQYLSTAQQRIWFLQQMEPHGTAFNMPLAVRLEGKLSLTVLQATLNALVERHEVLRTTYHMDTTLREVRQRAQSTSIAFTQISLADLHQDAAQQSALAALLRIEADTPFDLSLAPPLRVRLIQLSVDTHILQLTLHHIAADDWSLNILLQEFALIYSALAEQRAPALNSLPLQYADFAVWQQARLRSEGYQAQLGYWQSQFATLPPVLELPLDRQRPALQTFHGQTQQWSMPADLSAQVHQVAQAHRLTPAMLLMSVWYMLLWRYSGQSDLCVGMPIANRSRQELEPVFGCFLNMLPIRAQCDTALTAIEFSTQVKQQLLAAQAAQEVSFEQLLDVLDVPRSLSYSPLFQVMFNFLQAKPIDTVSLPDLAIQPLEVEGHTAKYDLSLNISEHAAHYNCHLEYNTDLFNPETAARMLGHYKQLLSAMLQQPNARLGSLPLLSTDESRTQLKAWNATDLPLPVAQDMIALFESQVARIPDQVAVTFGPDSISYQALNERANQLAHWLRQQGVTTDRLVAVSLEREVMLLVALLAIQKAGGGYLPLDPAQPKDRNAYIIEHAQPVLLLTRDALQQDAYIPCPILTLEAFDQVRHELPAVNLGLAVHDRQLAYALYTSGSTGRPKGVQIERIAFVNFLHAMQAQLSLSTQHRFLAITTLGFDIAGLELFLSLVQGATVVLTSRSEAQDSGALIGLLQQHAITHLQATPATWQMLLDEADSQVWRGLNALCGGEALGAELATRLLARGVNLLNVYGPTETTVWSAAYPVKGVNQSVLPIGQAIANNRLYILDGELNPVPIGAVGDLYIGGIGLARGYLARPDLTAAAFIPNPFADQSNDQNSDQNNGYGSGLGSRLYRTGDLARYRADGTIDFLGRSDFQVKIRGFRIELGEIEAVLERHPQIRQAVVTAFDDRLAAYVTVDQDQSQSLSLSDIQAFAGNLLPAYMVPSSVTVLESFPLNSNGKVDRKQLPEPTFSSVDQTPPEGATEIALASLWQQILKVDGVGREDNFFQLGGHSLQLTRLKAQIQQEFDCLVELVDLFRSPQLNQMAGVIAQAQSQSGNDDLDFMNSLLDDLE